MKQDWHTCRPRTAEAILDRISRTRALTMAESIGLERAIKAQTGECLDELVRAASEITHVAVREIKSREVCQRIARVRAAVILAAHERRISFEVIGRYFNHTDHTSAMCARNRARDLEATDPSFAKLMSKLREVE